jgi:hypothetical protein
MPRRSSRASPRDRGARAAYEALGAADLRYYRGGHAPVVGRTQALAASTMNDERNAWVVERSEVARSGDFGYARGNYAAARRAGTARLVPARMAARRRRLAHRDGRREPEDLGRHTLVKAHRALHRFEDVVAGLGDELHLPHAAAAALELLRGLQQEPSCTSATCSSVSISGVLLAAPRSFSMVARRSAERGGSCRRWPRRAAPAPQQVQARNALRQRGRVRRVEREAPVPLRPGSRIMRAPLAAIHETSSTRSARRFALSRVGGLSAQAR